MACTWGSKVNGILTVFTIGIAVAIDLWDILDIKKGHTMVNRGRLSTNVELISSVTGLLWKALYGKDYWFDRGAIYHLPVLLLHPLQDPCPVGPRRHFHEPCLPRNIIRQ
jgi:hypothetical protein